MRCSGYIRYGALLLVTAAACICGDFARAITIPTVPIGNPGNPADLRYIDGDHPSLGSVARAFNIGNAEVTNAQYAEFLNAVAGTDPYGLYAANMSADTLGGIVRSGASPNYLYAVKSNNDFVAYLVAPNFNCVRRIV